jgi:hypothetical protein
MQLNFTEVNYDGDLEAADKESLLGLVQRYEDAQEQNAAEFEAAKETVEELNGTVSEFEDAKEALVSEVADADRFSEVPLTEEQLEAQSFEQVREWKEFVEVESEPDEDDDKEFDDMGTEGEINPEDGEGGEYDESVASIVDGLSGVNAE